ncbi:MAG: hypothetical protein KA313_03505 [Pseudarcicella sp.]|nr:hypothetical protein [Pseudarcicella sp.]MBP6410140.1 hypothetical protein [Pseudarcicella sp.]
MIVYGSRSKELAKEISTDKCQHCGTQNSIELYVFLKYAHAFWIPFFPIYKTGISQCDHCKQVLKLEEMPYTLRESYENLVSQTKTPKWMFSGLAFVAILIIIGNINSHKNEEKKAELIQTLQSRDILEIKMKDDQYTLYKIDHVRGDSVMFQESNYETNNLKGIDDLKSKGDSAYSNEVFWVPKSELKMMLEKGDIVDINRK